MLAHNTNYTVERIEFRACDCRIVGRELCHMTNIWHEVSLSSRDLSQLPSDQRILSTSQDRYYRAKWRAYNSTMPLYSVYFSSLTPRRNRSLVLPGHFYCAKIALRDCRQQLTRDCSMLWPLFRQKETKYNLQRPVVISIKCSLSNIVNQMKEECVTLKTKHASFQLIVTKDLLKKKVQLYIFRENY